MPITANESTFLDLLFADLIRYRGFRPEGLSTSIGTIMAALPALSAAAGANGDITSLTACTSLSSGLGNLDINTASTISFKVGGVLKASLSHTGVLAATSFSGDGSTLTGIAMSKSFAAPADGAAASTTAEYPILHFPNGATVTSVVLVPDGAVVGDNTNNATITFYTRDGIGGGAVPIATITTTVAAGNFVQFVAKTLTLSSSAIVAGGILTYAVTKGALGVQLPRLAFSINYTN